MRKFERMLGSGAVSVWGLNPRECRAKLWSCPRENQRENQKPSASQPSGNSARTSHKLLSGLSKIRSGVASPRPFQLFVAVVLMGSSYCVSSGGLPATTISSVKSETNSPKHAIVTRPAQTYSASSQYDNELAIDPTSEAVKLILNHRQRERRILIFLALVLGALFLTKLIALIRRTQL